MKTSGRTALNSLIVLTISALSYGCGSSNDRVVSAFDVDDTDWKPTPKDALAADYAASDAAADASQPLDTQSDTAPATDSQADSGPDAVIVADVGGGLPSEITQIGAPASFFDVAGIHTVKLSVDATEWAAYMAGVNQPDGLKVYDWHPATVEIDEKPYGSVGLHGFGNGSQLDNPQKPNIRIKFDQYDGANVGPDGEKAFRLKASGQDATFVRELLAGALLRDIGGNAPRAGWARVWVNGQDFGPYQLQESVDKRYFKQAFGNNDGDKFATLYGCYGFDCPEGGCDKLAAAWEGSPGNTQTIADLAQAISEATDADLKQVLNDHFYLGDLLANYAVDALLSNIDGLASAGQNFTVYNDMKTKRLRIIATGTDLTFGGFDAWYDLQTPWGKPNAWCPARVDQLYARIWQVPELKAKLLNKFKALQCGMFRPEVLLPLVTSYKLALKPFLSSDPKNKQSAAQIEVAYGALASYIQKRQQTLTDLLGACP